MAMRKQALIRSWDRLTGKLPNHAHSATMTNTATKLYARSLYISRIPGNLLLRD